MLPNSGLLAHSTPTRAVHTLLILVLKIKGPRLLFRTGTNLRHPEFGVPHSCLRKNSATSFPLGRLVFDFTRFWEMWIRWSS